MNIKYPLEIEFTNHCTLNCISCISKDLLNKGEISITSYDIIINFIKQNYKSIEYITLGGLGDIFMHSKCILFLDKLKSLQGLNLKFLLPTKGINLSSLIISKIKELKLINNINISIQLGFFSLLNSKQNLLCGLYDKKFPYYNIFKKNIVELKKNGINFSLELLLTKFSENEIKNFNSFCKKIGVNGVVHKLHNFGGKLKEYNHLLSNSEKYNAFHCSINESLENNSNSYYYDKCGFFPYINFEGNIYPGTFCTHYYIGNIKDFVYDGGFIDILKKCHNTIDLNNPFCYKCTHNIVNN